jgi:hypothetical protein
MIRAEFLDYLIQCCESLFFADWKTRFDHRLDGVLPRLVGLQRAVVERVVDVEEDCFDPILYAIIYSRRMYNNRKWA